MPMKPRFVDTNIFVSVIARKDAISDKCKKLLRSNEPLWATHLVILEIEWVLRSVYELSKPDIVDKLRRILKIKFLEISNRKLIIAAVDLFEQTNIDLTDCFNILLAKKEGVTQFYTFDHDFDKFPGIKRLEP